MVVVAFTWQRYHQPLPNRAEWRRQEKIMASKEQAAEHPYAGMSVLDIMWQELDDVMDQLMEEGTPEKSSMAGDLRQNYDVAGANELAGHWFDTLREWGELRGQAQGVAYAIAVLTNPYAVDVDAVRKEAVARWRERTND